MITKRLTTRALAATKLTIIALLFTSSALFAQVKVGDNPTVINAGSALEIESTNKGLLMPRVSLTNTTTWGLAGTAAAGMHVYNTNVAITSTNTTYPTLTAKIGEYYWDGTGWVALDTVSPKTVITSYMQSAGATVSLPAGGPTCAFLAIPPPACAVNANLNGTLNITSSLNNVIIDVTGQYAAMLNGKTDMKIVVYIDKTTPGVYEPVGFFTNVLAETPSAALVCYATSFNYKLAVQNLPIRAYNIKVYIVPWNYTGSLAGTYGLGTSPVFGCGSSTTSQFLITSVTQ